MDWHARIGDRDGLVGSLRGFVGVTSASLCRWAKQRTMSLAIRSTRLTSGGEWVILFCTMRLARFGYLEPVLTIAVRLFNPWRRLIFPCPILAGQRIRYH